MVWPFISLQFFKRRALKYNFSILGHPYCGLSWHLSLEVITLPRLFYSVSQKDFFVLLHPSDAKRSTWGDYRYQPQKRIYHHQRKHEGQIELLICKIWLTNDILFVCIIYSHDDINKIITFIDHIIDRKMDRISI